MIIIMIMFRRAYPYLTFEALSSCIHSRDQPTNTIILITCFVLSVQRLYAVKRKADLDRRSQACAEDTCLRVYNWRDCTSVDVKQHGSKKRNCRVTFFCRACAACGIPIGWGHGIRCSTCNNYVRDFHRNIGRTFIATQTGFSLQHKQDFLCITNRTFIATQTRLSAHHEQDFNRTTKKAFIAIQTGLSSQHRQDIHCSMERTSITAIVTFIATRGGL